ncbi:MAG: hypothetical protein Greene041679_208 [Parcubacteria group bacterium Greene0416_79]|nr:MAG: hypothetical protein Greene041679_208 [Parcubacteria group bacterium Greene0416_79]
MPTYALSSTAEALRGEKRIRGASQDLERFVFKMRKVYSVCKTAGGAFIRSVSVAKFERMI